MVETENDSSKNKGSFKILILGDQAVGKSSLLMRYVDDKFTLNMMGTAGIDCKRKVVEYKNQKVNLIFFDSAGHERFRHITETYYKGSKGIILVYDATDRNSFNNVSGWISNIKEHSGSNAELIIVGNKIDLPDKAVGEVEMKELSEKYNIKVFEVSAKTGQNVDSAFFTLITNILENKELSEGFIKDIVSIENTIKSTDPKPLNKQGGQKEKKSGCFVCG